MPIDHWIDTDHRLVRARARGILTDDDVFKFQREIGSNSAVAGYDELVDMTEVEHIALPSVGRIRDLARLSAGMDARGTASKFAIVAPSPLAYGLGRMYEAYRGLESRSTRNVAVFKTLPEALAFLGIKADGERSKGTGA